MADKSVENSVKTKNEKADLADEILLDKSAWMIRPCTVYDAEHKECLKPRGRFYQYYIDGEFADCSIWFELSKECRNWTKNDDVKAAVTIIQHEKELVEKRIQSRLQNDVWVRRSDNERPPPNWEDPLPPHILEKHKDSYLLDHQNDLLQPLDSRQSSCCIS